MLEGAQARRKERSWGVPLLVLALLVLALCAGGYAFSAISADAGAGSRVSQPASGAIPNPISAGELSYDEIPGFTGEPSAEVNGNVPFFTEEDRARGAFEEYSPLDSRGRCGTAFALVGPETLPDGPRGDIAMVKPSGWRISRYAWIDGEFLFNRCHLIAFSLAAENANELNLITGTRYMNVEGMLPYEEMTASYIYSTGNHVLYRVTPVFLGKNLVASGVLIEAESVEDDGAGIRFCVWCYNVQPGVVIEYRNGANYEQRPTQGESSSAAASGAASAEAGETAIVGGDAGASGDATGEAQTYVLNTRSHRFHYPDCPSVEDMGERNKQMFEGTRDEAIERGYEPCGACNP